ncbi:YciI family protein [Kitasatospora sp. CM 4170]|uniref:YciI family protein n=1 Tax=Kitasatospora aburaviensis TaxID=67265 RepID=A0ABW1EXN9_9ACTN|nr:YciI family protein [Kitasatospora sp. CM 4170]WNM49679.1 YciI family protein [Kitasatospora sp. CM 4170]
MFVLELTYTAPLDRIDAVLPEHVTWLKGHYEAGTFLASGRKVPRDGGMVLAVAEDRAAIEAITGSDPFTLAGLAEYRVTEFVASTTAPALDAFREQLPA